MTRVSRIPAICISISKVAEVKRRKSVLFFFLKNLHVTFAAFSIFFFFFFSDRGNLYFDEESIANEGLIPEGNIIISLYLQPFFGIEIFVLSDILHFPFFFYFYLKFVLIRSHSLVSKFLYN